MRDIQQTKPYGLFTTIFECLFKECVMIILRNTQGRNEEGKGGTIPGRRMTVGDAKKS